MRWFLTLLDLLAQDASNTDHLGLFTLLLQEGQEEDTSLPSLLSQERENLPALLNYHPLHLPVREPI